MDGKLSGLWGTMECMLERRPTRAYVEEEREERVYHPPPSLLQVRHPSLHPHLLQLLSISTYRFACFSSCSKNMLYQIAFWTLWICMTYTMSFWSSFNVYRIYGVVDSCHWYLMKYNMLHLIWCQVYSPHWDKRSPLWIGSSAYCLVIQVYSHSRKQLFRY